MAGLRDQVNCLVEVYRRLSEVKVRRTRLHRQRSPRHAQHQTPLSMSRHEKTPFRQPIAVRYRRRC
jgi:hypothetical protein